MGMPKILLDTNILISLIIYGGEVEKVFYEMENKRYEIYVSNYIDHEFRNKILQKWSKDKKYFRQALGPVFLFLLFFLLLKIENNNII